MNDCQHQDQDHGAADGQFADLIGDLDRLGEAMRRQTYPGSAWAGEAPRARRWNRRIVACVAAAAAVVLVGAAIWVFCGHGSPPAPPPPAPVAGPTERPPFWKIPTDVGASLRAGRDIRVPSLETTTTRPADRPGWNVPTISFWMPRTRSNSNGS